jgi:hypothetical protein
LFSFEPCLPRPPGPLNIGGRNRALQMAQTSLINKTYWHDIQSNQPGKDTHDSTLEDVRQNYSCSAVLTTSTIRRSREDTNLWIMVFIANTSCNPGTFWSVCCYGIVF